MDDVSFPGDVEGEGVSQSVGGTADERNWHGGAAEVGRARAGHDPHVHSVVESWMKPHILRKVLGLAILVACGEDTSKYARGRGLDVAQLPATDRAAIYVAALGGSFDLDPGLSLLVDTLMLTRTGGEGPGAPLGADVRAALRSTGVTKGECAPQRRAPTRTPVCRAEIPGYVVRFSDVFAMAGDSVQTHVVAERYDTPSTGEHNRFTIEQAYQLVRRDGGWHAVRKARID